MSLMHLHTNAILYYGSVIGLDSPFILVFIYPDILGEEDFPQG